MNRYAPFALVLLMGCSHKRHVYHIATDDRLEYWVSPSVHNGNGKTHVCAYLDHGDDGVWYAYDILHDIKGGPELTPVSFKTRDAAVVWIETLCGKSEGEVDGSHI